ncbi:MAG: hypothetical protein KA010_03230 [Saprospiraceae bacterium]|nr:hypothetical protein [Saprospiraceae bacterium]
MLVGNVLTAQSPLFGIYTKWSDSFVSWEIINEDEDVVGSIEQLWMQQNNWKEWRVEIDGHSGIIRQKWKDDPSQWNVTLDEEIVNAQTRWTGDFKNWRITNNDIALNLECKYGNVINEWLINDKNYGTLRLRTLEENDPRDWIIEDDLDESVPIAIRMAAVFLAVFNSSPKL